MLSPPAYKRQALTFYPLLDVESVEMVKAGKNTHHFVSLTCKAQLLTDIRPRKMIFGLVTHEAVSTSKHTSIRRSQTSWSSALPTKN